MLNIYPQDPDGAEQGQFLATRRRGKCRKRYDLGSERSGEYRRYISKPRFQDDLGVVRPEFQTSRETPFKAIITVGSIPRWNCTRICGVNSPGTS